MRAFTIIGGIVLASGAWWLLARTPAPPAAPPQREAVGPAAPAERFAAALAQVVNSGGDTLRLDDFPATDAHFQTLSELERLRVLRLSGGQCSAAAARSLANMPQLEQLHLRNVALDDAAIAAIAESRSLWLLNVSGAAVSPQAIERLADLPRLRQLRLGIKGAVGNGDAYAAAVAKIEGLQSLHLIGIGVTDQGLRALAKLPRLQSLYLDDTQISEDGWTWLFTNHSHLHVHIDQQHHDRDPQRH